jgi:hypothetical protein
MEEGWLTHNSVKAIAAKFPFKKPLKRELILP